MDPRRFPFALICMWDGEMRDSLQATRQHLGECSGGKIRDLMCGHYELRTSWWPMLCDHLNQPGMETKAACRPEFRMSRTVPKLFSSLLPSLSPSTLRDVSMRGKRYRTHESLSPEQLISFRGEAARLRRSSDRSPNIPSSVTTVVCIEPDPGPLSTLEESPTTIAVASLTVETDDVEPEGLAGLEFPLPYGPSSSPQSNPRDHSGVVPSEASGPVGLEDGGADNTVQGCVLQVPEGVIPPEGWTGWSPTAFRQEVQEAVEVLLQDEPAGLPATPPVGVSTSPPLVVASVPTWEPTVPTSIEPTEGTPRVAGADSSTANIPSPAPPPPSLPVLLPVVKKEPDEIVVISSPEGERLPPPQPTDSNPREIRRLKRQNLSYLRQLKFWASTVKVLGSEHPRRPTPEEQMARRLVVIGLMRWRVLRLSPLLNWDYVSEMSMDEPSTVFRPRISLLSAPLS